MWPYIWIAFMLALVISTIVVAMREKKAREKAMKKMAPQPLEDPALGDDPEAMDGGFGESDPVDSFGTDAAEDFADLDENAFK